MIISHFFVFLLLFTATRGNNATTAQIIWSAAVLGSAGASRALRTDFGDGPALLSVSADGEVSLVDLFEGTALPSWPLYLSNDHFFAAPVQYIHGGSKSESLFIIVSLKGQIFFVDFAALVVRTKKINNIYIKKNWELIHYTELTEIIFLENDSTIPMTELYPQIFADVTLIDLNINGVRNDLIIPVNFVSKGHISNNVIVSAVVVFDLAMGYVINIHFINISKKESEYPGYILTPLDILRKKDCHAIVSLASGIIYQLQWNKHLRKFETIQNSKIMYNQGPHNCEVTSFCSDLKGNFLKNYLCCLYGDLYGHLAMVDLTKHKLMWEYNTAQVAIPTSPKIFQDSTNAPYVIFATNKGWIYCVSLLTGTSRKSFPFSIHNESFSSGAEVIYDSKDNLYVMLLSDKGHLFRIPLLNPSLYTSIFYHPNIPSYLPPLLLPSSSHQTNLDIIVQSKTGFIFRITIPDSKKKHESFVRADINSVNPLEVGLLYGLGSAFSFNIKITDPRNSILQSPQYYVIKVYVNEYIYYTHEEPHSGHEITDVTVVINMLNLNKSFVPSSVFLFGTATILVTDSLGIAFSSDMIRVRINYDFQFELIWIVYLTFFICCAAILLFHLSDHNSKFHIPFHVARNS